MNQISSKVVSHVVRLGVAGVGTVGASVIKAITKEASLFQPNYSQSSHGRLEVVMASVRNVQAQRDCDLSGIQLTTNALDLVCDEVDLIVELIGGTDTSYDLVERALTHNKPVVTANKALLAERGEQLYQLAVDRQVPLLFEGAVAGGVPIIKVLRDSMNANHITQVAGILNGTCNYILSRMEADKIDYHEALADAQRLGYAEADPTLDVDGIDAAHKIAILARLCFRQRIPFADVFNAGLKAIQLIDIHQARKFGYRIKPLALAKRFSDGLSDSLEMQVQPHLVPLKSLLSNINEVINCVELVGHRAGVTTYCGAGAGADATASAVLSDLLEMVKAHQTGNLPSLIIDNQLQGDAQIKPIENVQCAYYLRVHAADKPGALHELTESFERFNISIERIQQQVNDQGIATISLITNTVSFKVMHQAIHIVLKSKLFTQEHCLIPIYH